MKKRKGLRLSHANLVEKLVKYTTATWTAAQIKDTLWVEWGRIKPTSREIGTYLKIHPNMHRVNKNGPCAEYKWN
tara:strand:- start:2877 stop:3101 length:225 start_codon:yes stop_codon:yes gene_type:complete